jgi:hypothetical protein
LFNAPRYPDVERMGAAGDDVDVVPAFAHDRRVGAPG